MQAATFRATRRLSGAETLRLPRTLDLRLGQLFKNVLEEVVDHLLLLPECRRRSRHPIEEEDFLLGLAWFTQQLQREKGPLTQSVFRPARNDGASAQDPLSRSVQAEVLWPRGHHLPVDVDPIFERTPRRARHLESRYGRKSFVPAF